MKISDLYLLILSKIKDAWNALNSPFKFFIALTLAYFSILTISGVSATGYIWSFRKNLLVGNIYSLSPSYYFVIINNFFVPSTIATIGVGMLKLTFRQVTRYRTNMTKFYLPARRFVHRNQFFVWVFLFILSSALIFMPGWLSVYFFISALFSTAILYISIYSSEFRFSARELLSLEFYRFFNRRGASPFRKNSVRVTWTVAVILSFSFLFGYYEYRAALTRCVSIDTKENNPLNIEKVSIVLSGEKGLIVSKCGMPAGFMGSKINKDLVFIPSSDISYISME